MDSQARTAVLSASVFASIFVVLIAGFVFAEHIVRDSSDGDTSFGIVNEDRDTIFNLSVNNTDMTAGANITEVNVTFDSSFRFTSGSNITTAPAQNFTNTTTILSWTNISSLIGANTTHEFVFNATGTVPGDYNFTISTINASGTFYNNISVTVNDTNLPTITFTDPTPANGTTINSSTLKVNVSVSDDAGIDNVQVQIYSQDFMEIEDETTVLGGGNSTVVVFERYHNLFDGNYIINVTANDTNGFQHNNFSIVAIDAPLFFNGSTLDITGSPLNNTLVNVSIYDTSMGFSFVGSNFTYSNASGYFEMNISDEGGFDWMYQINVIHTNATAGHVDYVGKNLPSFPSDVLNEVSGLSFYLRDGGTLNITAVNETGDYIPFNYQVKDQRLGYPVAEAFEEDEMVSGAVVNVPADRTYSIMIFPNESMPVSADWSNFSSSVSFNLSSNNLSWFDADTNTLHKTFNTTMGYARVHGNFTYNNITGWDELTVVPYLLEPGDMAHATFGTIPYNLSAFFDTGYPTDVYNLSEGSFNISLPATVEDSSMILFLAAENNSMNVSVGGFHNLSLGTEFVDGAGRGNNTGLNFDNIFGMLGEDGNITMDGVMGPEGKVVNTTLQTFNLINSTNGAISNVFAHIEVDIDYSDYGVMPFTWMVNVEQDQSTASFSLPLLNVTGVEEMNIYAGGGDGDYAPRRISKTAEQIRQNNSITLNSFDPEGVDENINDSDIFMALYFSNNSCDIPDPASPCSIGGTESGEEFNPFGLILGGGKLSFRMGTGNISVHYINVDLLASGPPDALFESNASQDSSNDFESSLRFGSLGPTIYDYILVSMPYDDNTAGSGLNESEPINVSIPLFYDDDWNVIWNVTSNGANATWLAGNYSHYDESQDDWQVLMQGTQCHENQASASEINASSPCFVNKSTNVIWVRMPHFSGSGMEAEGTLIPTSTSTPDSDPDGNNNNNDDDDSTDTFSWTTLPRDDDEFILVSPLSEVLQEQDRVRILLSGENHYVGIIDVDSNDDEVTVNVSSDPQQWVFSVDESHSFDVDHDDFYDVRVTLEEIVSNIKANVTIEYLDEPVPSDDSVCGDGVIEGSEGCDDGNTDNGDGCSSSCVIEANWTCSGEPSSCSESVTEAPEESSFFSNLWDDAVSVWWLWVVILVVLLGWVGFIVYQKMHDKSLEQRVKVKSGEHIKVT